MKTRLTALLPMLLAAGMAWAQTASTNDTDKQPFKHLDLGLTMGTTGIGLELASPISNSVRLRTGFDIMPHFNYNMNFGIQVGDDPSLSASKFQRLQSSLESFTGYKVDDKIRMVGHPNYYNFKLLVDVFPFHDKRWYFTAGFYWGNSTIGKAINTTEDMTSLLAVGIYNNIYDRAYNMESIDIAGQSFGIDPGSDAYQRLMNYGRMGIHLGDYTHEIPMRYQHDEYYPFDEYDDDNNIIHHAGDIMYRKGDIIYDYDENGELVMQTYKPGDAYRMEPGDDGTVRARVKTNSFKPYLGAGFTTNLKSDSRYAFSVDCGLLFWGGTPEIYTHDGINLARDVDNIGGKVGRYVDFIKTFKVFPTVNVKISRRLF